MCLKQSIELFSSSESIDNLNDNIVLDWTLEQVFSLRLIIACNLCFYPISLEQFVLREIRDENNISFGIIIPMQKLFSTIEIYNENCIEQWKTEIFCPNCGTLLSFLGPQFHNLNETNFEKISSCIEHDEQIVILQTNLLYRGSGIEALSRFRHINNL